MKVRRATSFPVFGCFFEVRPLRPFLRDLRSKSCCSFAVTMTCIHVCVTTDLEHVSVCIALLAVVIWYLITLIPGSTARPCRQRWFSLRWHLSLGCVGTKVTGISDCNIQRSLYLLLGKIQRMDVCGKTILTHAYPCRGFSNVLLRSCFPPNDLWPINIIKSGFYVLSPA